MHNKHKIIILAALAILSAALFISYDLGYWQYTLPRRIEKVAAIVLTGGAIAFSSVIFQTITNNRILTPSILGLDSLYLFLQTFIVYIFGSTNIVIMNKNLNFLLCVSLMIIFSVLLYILMFKKAGKNIFFILLVGIVFGTLFKSMSSFMEMLIDPNEFQVVQDKSFASFNNVNTDLLYIAAVIFILLGIYVWHFTSIFDVLSLGREHAVNLGIDYDKLVKKMLIVIAIFVSVATALVGPITFLGLLVVNLARELFKTYKHTYLMMGSLLLSVIALVGGEFIVEKVFTFSTTLSVIIDFAGGIYFIYLLLKENKSW
ncbi:iron chelate uptake ABC transporter family permease subunit [Priestia aryabhattai]|uniref:iron chelate uptake ABC transporter family permease subunit n=1 Tax=Priestia aryabhattai TaxID=412384 RepID=UPI001C8CFA7C|nr:iron chelate uptake ABC transporter family permease subunit [Priestia aryabhattai]MBX9986033.1 iron chelate uptake ABC transporter family permease subunit [Priestia aryabhattai]MBY0000071.1 iron chelate uptake ABC transporter family permease subunit [Priestia aryabhattai]